MYLKKLRLQNIKCFEDVTLEFPGQGGDFGGWNVILGENGRGKSTLLRSIALGVLNSFVAYVALEQHEGRFARVNTEGKARVTTDLLLHPIELRQTGTPLTNYRRSLTFTTGDSPEVSVASSSRHAGEETIPHVHCYGYGPFRRLNGSASAIPTAFQFPQPLSRFVTLFTDGIGLADSARALRDLYVASVDEKHTSHAPAKLTLDAVCRVVNALLPEGTRLDSVSSEAVQFSTAPGLTLTEKELSDGYRSFLSLALDLLRHLTARLGSAFADRIQEDQGRIAIDVEGVVLIDEADAHLHPSWQRELGERLRRVFPRIQFIVTSHSPFIAQEATDRGLFVLRAGEKGTVTVDQPVESVRGWTASQILTSPLFGLESTRGPRTESLIQESAALTARERAGTLSPGERERLAEVQRQLSAALSAPGETYDEMRRQQGMTDYIEQTLKAIGNSKQ